MTDPELLLLDEPAASLDLGAREELLILLGGYAQAPTTPAMVMVTHHVEEIPVGFTHVLLLRDGRVVAAGPLAEALTAENLTEAFGVPITLTADGGRYAARAQLLDPDSASALRADRIVPWCTRTADFHALAKSSAPLLRGSP